MRLMARNGRTIYYQMLTSTSAITNDDSYDTGENVYTYDSPVAVVATVSPPDGRVARTAYGASDNYDRIVLIDDMSCPISDTSLLWLDEVPRTVDGQLTNKADYIVVRIAKALNHIKVVARKT